MDVQVEVQFKVAHTVDELREEFVKRGHIPDWKVLEGTEDHPELFFEDRLVSWDLSSEPDRFAWFVFSLEASGELHRRVVIHNVIPVGVKIDHSELKPFLQFCRECLVSSPRNK